MPAPLASELIDRFRPVLSRRTGVAMAVWGEAGIGKSHAVRGLLGELPCESATLPATLPIPRLLGALPGPRRPVRWAMRTLDGVAEGDRPDPAALGAALAAHLGQLGPFVLHLEDLHEADEERSELLRHVARGVRAVRGAGLIVTSRFDPSPPFLSLKLPPLTPPASAELLEGRVGGKLPRAALDWIYARAAGNPLFTLEYLRHLRRLGHLYTDGVRWRWREPPSDYLPTTVEALIDHRIGSLNRDADARAAMGALALLGGGGGDAVWIRVAALTPERLKAAARRLEAHGLVVSGAFTHPLYREVALRSLSAESRRELARRAVSALNSSPTLAARHVNEAGLPPRAALELLNRAAAAVNDPLAKAQFKALAVEHATGEERGHLALEAAKLYEGADHRLTFELARLASEQLGDPPEALYLQAAALALQGEYERAERYFERAKERAAPGSLWLRRQLLLLHRTGRHEALLRAWEEERKLSQLDGYALYCVCWAYIQTGALPKAEALLDEWESWSMKRRPNGSDLLDVGEVRASLAYHRGEFAEAARVFDQLVDAAQGELDLTPEQLANLLRNRAVNRMQLGEIAACLPDLEEALHIYQEAGNPVHYAQTLVMASYAHHEAGNLEAAEDALLDAIGIFGAGAFDQFQVHALTQLALLYLEWGAPAHTLLALRHSQEAVQLAAGKGAWTELAAACAYSQALSANYRAEQGLRVAEAAAVRAGELAYREANIRATFAAGEALEALGESSRAAEKYEAAGESAAELGMPIDAARYRMEASRLRGDTAALTKALAWFEERGLRGRAARARQLLGAAAPSLDAGGAARESPGYAEGQDEERSSGAPKLLLFGGMRIARGSATREAAEEVRGAKRIRLLLCLLEARALSHAQVTRLELLEELYFGEDELRAASALKALVHTLRERWGRNMIHTTNDGYALGHCTSDVEEFLETKNTELFRGPYLEGEQGSALGTALHVALAQGVEALLASGPEQAAEAARAAQLLTAAEPYRSDYLRLLLRALRAGGEEERLEAAYADGVRRFAELGERLPEEVDLFLEGGLAGA